MQKAKEAFDFSELFPLRDQIEQFSPLEGYEARDGSSLTFRRYPSNSHIYLVLIHGSSAHSAYLHPYGKYLSENNIASVYAPDLRGHGPSPDRRGDINYVGQLEDDLADLMLHIKQTDREARFFVGGHSSGGGLALRFAGGKYASMVEGVILLAPYLGHKAPMVKRNAGGWVTPNIPKIIGLSILNGFGIKLLNGAKVLKFNLPQECQTGFETLEYSYRLMLGMHPDKYTVSLMNMTGQLLIMLGAEDEAFRASAFGQLIIPYKPDADISFIEGVKHLGVIVDRKAIEKAGDWISKLT